MVQFIGTITKLTSHDDDFGDDELGYTSRVRKGAVEDSNPMPRGIVQIDLVCSNTETPNNDEIFCLAKNFLTEFCL